MSAVSLKTECRTCLEKTGSVLPIFMVDEEFGVDTSFAEIIMSSCPSVQINSNDGLPDSICSDCAAKLLDFYKFKVKIEQNQLVLRSRVSDLNTDVKNCINQCEIPIKKEYLSDDSENEEPCTTNKAETENGLYEFKHKIDAFEHEIIKQEFNNDMNVDCDELVIQDELIEEGEVLENQENNLLPNKMRKLYEKQYYAFKEWCRTNKVDVLSENVLLEYFKIQREMYKPTTLWVTYSKLRSCLKIVRGVDISQYSKLLALLKRTSKGYEPKKSRILEEEDVGKFIREADDKMYLAMKIILIMGYNGGCRREELTNMSTDDVEYKSNSILVTIPKTKNNIPRIFEITNEEWIKLVKKYFSLRPSTVTHKRFFLTYRNGRCINSPIGINTMGKVSKEIASFLNLEHSEEYTSHCFRRSSATHLAKVLSIKRTVSR